MDRYFQVENGRWKRIEVFHYTKRRERYFLDVEGRYGPAWLRRLVFRVASNLGMVGHPVQVDTLTTVSFYRMAVNDEHIIANIHKAIRAAQWEGLEPIEVVMGPEVFPELVRDMSRQVHIIAPYRRASPTAEIFGIPVRIVPNIKGALVLPLADWPEGVFDHNLIRL